MGSRPFTMIAALIFFAMALLHVYRVFTQFQIIIGSHTIPLWIISKRTNLVYTDAQGHLGRTAWARDHSQ